MQTLCVCVCARVCVCKLVYVIAFMFVYIVHLFAKRICMLSGYLHVCMWHWRRRRLSFAKDAPCPVVVWCNRM